MIDLKSLWFVELDTVTNPYPANLWRENDPLSHEEAFLSRDPYRRVELNITNSEESKRVSSVVYCSVIRPIKANIKAGLLMQRLGGNALSDMTGKNNSSLSKLPGQMTSVHYRDGGGKLTGIQ